MAEATGLRNNALPYPVYGAPWGIVFPMLDADGDLVTGATTPDAEVSKNGDTFADCTNESTEIATNSGMYYLLLTGTEMTADVVAVIAKSATAGMKTTPIVMYPRKLVTLRSGTVGANAGDGTTLQLDSSAVAVDDYYNGCLLIATIDTVVECRIIGDYVGSTKVCTVEGPAFNTAPDNNDTFIVKLPEGRQLSEANVTAWLGTAAATPATAGIPDVNAKNWNNLTTVELPLVPTTAGRKLDVSAGGEAGVDWANVGSPTTAVDLSGTNIKTNQKVDVETIKTNPVVNGGTVTFPTNKTLAATDNITAGTITTVSTVTGLTPATVHAGLDDIQARLPAALTAGGKIKASMDEILAVAQSATDLKDFADDGYDPATNKLEGVKLADTLTTYTGNTPQTGDVFPLASTEIADIKAKTDNLPSDPADASVVAGLIAGVQSVVDALPTLAEFFTVDSGEAFGDAVAGSVVKEIVDNAGGGSAPTAAEIADAVWDEALAGHLGAGSTGEALDNAGAASTPPTAAEVADAVWDEDATGHQTQGSFGQAIGDPAADTNTIYKAVVTDAAGANVAADVVAVKADTAAIKLKTDNLPSDPADASVIAGRFDTLDTSVADLPTNAELATALDPLPTAAENAAALLDAANGVETGLTPRQALKVVAAACAGKASGLGTATAVYRNAQADSKDRITADVDADGNRTAVTLDLT